MLYVAIALALAALVLLVIGFVGFMFDINLTGLDDPDNYEIDSEEDFT